MTITVRRVTGSIVLPTGEVPRNGRVTIALSGWDRENGQAIVMGPTTHILDGDGNFDAYLWCTDRGENGRSYVGVVQWFSTASGRTEAQPLIFAVATGTGPQPFAASWVVGDLPESTQADAVAQCLAAAAGAIGSASAASGYATAAAGSAMASANSAAIALAGSPYRLPTFASLASRLRYSGATGSQINVSAGDIIDIPAVGVFKVLASGAAGAHLDYTGSSGVKLEVQPLPTGTPVEAFGALPGPVAGVYTDAAPAIQKALDWSASAQGRVVYFSGDYKINATLTVPAAATVFSHRDAIIQPMPATGPANGVIIETGSMIGRNSLPRLHMFSGYGLIIDGTDIADIYVASFHSCGCAVRIAASETDKNDLDTIIEFGAVANCGAVVDVYSETSDCVVQGLVIKGNFVTVATTFLKRTGVACADDGAKIDVYAIDFTLGGGALFDNQIAGHAVPRLTVQIGTWVGGIGFTAATPTQIFKGRWDNARIEFVDAQLFDQTNLTPELVRGSSWSIRNSRASSGAAVLVPLGTALSGFNSGKMLCETDFMATITLPIAVANGATFGASFFHALADGNYQRWTAVMQQGASGLIVEAVHDQSATVAGRVVVVLRNISGAPIAAGATIYLAIARG